MRQIMTVLLGATAAGAAAAADTSLTSGTGELPARPPGRHCPLTAANHRDTPTFHGGRPVVGTTYFYWYDIASKAHITNGDGTDALTTHPADMKGISYKSAPWHRQQMADMIEAGIDFLMPVFWGYPGDYDTHWSFVGLPPMVLAHDALIKAGKKPPAIGLFYDTSSLQHNRRGAGRVHADLSTPFGKDWFYTTIRDFFSMIPPDKWARVNGKPIVFLYSPSFARKQDPQQLDYVRGRFRRDFGCGVYIVRHIGWQGEPDAEYSWGGALGLKIGNKVAGLGPGYDHTAVPGRSPLVVDRRTGAFYKESWSRLLAMRPARRPFMVHVETWNEWHEGTDVAESKEYGRQYIELTRHYADLFRRGVRIEPVGKYAKASRVTWRDGKADGLTLRPSGGDGVWEQATRAGRTVVVSKPNDAGSGRYLYFQIDDSFLYDESGVKVNVTVTYLDAECERFTLEYDSTRTEMGPVSGAFRPARPVKVGNQRTLKNLTLGLPDCRFANRGNQADFRLAIEGGTGELAVAEVSVARASP